MNHLNTRLYPTLVAALAVATALPALANIPTGELLHFDIAEDGTRFVFDEEHRFEDGLPAYGNVFTTQGYIYPRGLLTCTDEGCNGVLEDGSPEFPEQVLGEWTCWGTHVGDGARTLTGPWVITNQQFDLGQRFGDQTVLTNGYELVDIDVPVKRAIQGGTGRFTGAEGQQQQTLLGFNPSDGVALRVVLSVQEDAARN
ncbi:MAG: hypothetical protein AAGA68_02650 [Pseudomonadota bacterium]